MKILGIIPARYASTRLPAKALADIGGKPMVQRVYEQAQMCSALSQVIVATDHEEIYKTVQQFGHVQMTSPDHLSGTDRCAEVLNSLDEQYDFIINIQGDEPFINPEQISLLASILTKETELATLIKRITNNGTLFNPNIPKVLINSASEAMYFSRSTIPNIRGVDEKDWLSKHTFYKHIGIYAYRSDVLKKITLLRPGMLELAESLEQLRWLENGYNIKVAITEMESMGIDTPEDLKKARKMV
jgi:3-deoxy-manno-octulosonate cytidylyltransferase (CMP-KDO synthetase)